jgi:leucyl aminopeptidase
MKISYRKAPTEKDKVLLVPFFSGLENVPEAYRSWLKARLKSGDLSEKKDAHVTFFPGSSIEPGKIVFFSFGAKEEAGSRQVRSTLAKAVKKLRRHPLPELSVLLGGHLLKFPREIGEALALSNYNQAIYKTGSDKKESEEKMIKKIVLISSKIDRVQKFEIEEGVKVGLAVNEVRDLVNSPHNIVNVETLSARAAKICAENRINITVLDRKQLERLKMGALLAVNSGSEHPARLVVMEYLPLGKRQDPLVLVGKGVTFDTGGVNIKPTQGLSEMHMDMAGAAAVLGVFMLLRDLDIRQNVIGVLPLTDNSVDANSQKPSDIITSFSGKTIEVGNTDAEGRLILCDAISYAIKKYKPSAVIDIATLTGACMVALGDQIAGMWGNNDQMKERLKNAALETDEEVWEMPIHEIHRQGMKGKFADLNNIDSNTSGLAGACTAAAFIENFVDNTDWIHLDIAGPAMPRKPKDVDFPGASGYGVRLLTRFLQNIK